MGTLKGELTVLYQPPFPLGVRKLMIMSTPYNLLSYYYSGHNLSPSLIENLLTSAQSKELVPVHRRQDWLSIEPN
jgi:hypothetical protein